MGSFFPLVLADSELAPEKHEKIPFINLSEY